MDQYKVIIERKCPKCGSTEGQMNSGYDKAGSRRCVCRKCNYKYTLKKYTEEFKQEAILLYKSGLSARDIGQILKISKTSVYNWIKKLDDN